jgi:hypothetical protein
MLSTKELYKIHINPNVDIVEWTQFCFMFQIEQIHIVNPTTYKEKAELDTEADCVRMARKWIIANSTYKYNKEGNDKIQPASILVLLGDFTFFDDYEPEGRKAIVHKVTNTLLLTESQLNEMEDSFYSYLVPSQYNAPIEWKELE